jgi:hypothetical protein
MFKKAARKAGHQGWGELFTEMEVDPPSMVGRERDI